MSSEKREQLAGVETGITNSGPAFPFVCADISKTQVHEPGMSLRDYFAAKVLPHCVERIFSMLESGKGYIPSKDTSAVIAGMAYEFADAMLKKRDAK